MHTTALLLLLLTTTTLASPTAASPATTAPSVWASFPPVVAASAPATTSTTTATTTCPDDDDWVATTAPSSCVHIATHRPRTAGDGAPTLVVFLHADLYPVVLDSGFLRWLARTAPQAVVVGMLRPGFRDADGHTTAAVVEHGFGDAYRREDALVVREAIAALKERHHARRVVVVGSSGGAAIAANVAALGNGLVDDAVIASCPCDLDAWRAHRIATSTSAATAALWRGPSRSLSPLATASLVPVTTRVTLVAGQRDDNTPPSVHAPYLAALRAAGVEASLTIVDGSGHGVLDAPRARQLVRAILDPSSSTSLAVADVDGAAASAATPRAGYGAPRVRDAP